MSYPQHVVFSVLDSLSLVCPEDLHLLMVNEDLRTTLDVSKIVLGIPYSCSFFMARLKVCLS